MGQDYLEVDREIEEKRQQQRQRRREEMRRKKQQQMRIRKACRIGIPAFVVLVVVIGLAAVLHKPKAAQPNQTQTGQETDENISQIRTDEVTDPANGGDTAAGADDSEIAPANAQPADGQNNMAQDTDPGVVYSAQETPETTDVPAEVVSSYAILVDVGNKVILQQRNAQTIINPASMTKILTVLVAAEQIDESRLDDKVTITIEDTDYSYSNDCSNAGFELDEQVTVRDLFYGTILPSGAEAAVALAKYVAGSEEAFVELMNRKMEEMGLSQTAHFTNCVGLYDEAHHCSVYDMAMILEAAMDDPFCRVVLSTHTYTTSVTEQHPEGIILSNWFLRRIEDKDNGKMVLGAKTGYVVQSGNCAASYAQDVAGNAYVCVTGNATSSWRCIYDHVEIYKTVLGTNSTE